MEAEERPLKLRKLRQYAVDDEGGLIQALSNGHPEATALDADHDSLRNENAASDHADEASVADQETTSDQASTQARNSVPSNFTNNLPSSSQPISKNQLKKLRRKEEWEAGREDRKLKRKQKTIERKARKREAKVEAQANASGEEKARRPSLQPPLKRTRPRPRRSTLLPVTLIIDCGFDDLMTDGERISLGSQLTRSYSDNYKAPFHTHLFISSWGGLLKQRFDTVLERSHEKWRGVRFFEEDFIEVSKKAAKFMEDEKKGGKMAGIFERYAPPKSQTDESTPAPDLRDREVVYLTSDSSETLETLKPYSTYVVGGLVDKNRHKGICYKTACNKGIKTAKLPIGQYMEMQSRFVLATNHVVEIMLRWLECGDWGQAFLQVVPKRKGGKLKNDQNGISREDPQSLSEEVASRSDDEADAGSPSLRD